MKEYKPGGLWSDEPSYVYKKFPLRAGPHDIHPTLQEGQEKPQTIRSERVDFPAGRAVILPSDGEAMQIGKGGA